MTHSNTISDLTVAIIACDNERTIGQTIKSVAGIASRVIVVDSGSKDRTPDICRDFGAEVIPHDWEGHVKQKQFALEQCDTKWILSLDSDEWPDEDLNREIRRVIEADDPNVAGYAVNRRCHIGGKPLRHTFQPEWRTRLVRKGPAQWKGYDPHDRLDVSGRVGRLGGTLEHDAFEDTADLLRKMIGHGLHAAESYYKMGRRGSVLSLLISPPAMVAKQIFLRHGWLDGWAGWVAAFGSGMSAAAKYMRLLELSRKKSESE